MLFILQYSFSPKWDSRNLSMPLVHSWSSISAKVILSSGSNFKMEIIKSLHYLLTLLLILQAPTFILFLTSLSKSPRNGAQPCNISYNKIPNAQMSILQSYCFQNTISGAMYSYVPQKVLRLLLTQLVAHPRSHSLMFMLPSRSKFYGYNWQNLYFDVAVNYFSAVQVLQGLQSLVKVFKRLHLREPGTLILVIEEAAFLNELHDHVQPVVFDDAIPKLHDVRMVQFHVNLNLVLDDFQFRLIFNFFQVQLCQRACYNFNRVELARFYVSSQSDHTERTIAQYFILKDMEFSNGMKITFLLKFYHLKNHILSPQLMTFTSRLSEIPEQIIRLLCTHLMISRIHRGVNQKIQETIFKKLPVLFLPCPLRSHVGTARIENNSAQLKLKEFSMPSQTCRVIMDYNFLYNQDARQFFIPKYKLMASRGQEQCNKWGYQSTGQDPSEPKIQIKLMPNSYKNKLLMTIESEIQFEDFSHFESAYFRQTKSPEEIELELNLILGIAPLPLSMEQDPFECKMSLTQIIRKNSVNTVSQDTHPSQFDQESRDTNQSDHTTKTSNHHNFQKHTVTALKDMVKQEKFQIFCPNHQTLKLVTRLWRQFLKIKGRSIMTKKFLSALFRSDMKSVELLKTYGFKQMFQDFSESDILKAKIELRRLVVVFLTNQNIEDHVERRQIKRKEQFRLYLINFRQDLESANIKKRISKESSDWIADNAKIFDCLN